ncbi:MAG: hypothetical protein IKI02_08290 [Oscillospiraceae bacterium]|nr:hypothetical protein [Oscillospiraceae bacterium]
MRVLLPAHPDPPAPGGERRQPRHPPDGERGGTVAIRTRELEDRWELSVADDGAGFDPGQAASGAGSHVALSNVRSRLARVCGGSLLIESSPGKGTTATIRIPRTDGPKKS